NVTEAAQNMVFDFSVDGSAPIPRRAVVDQATCSNSHGTFSKVFSIHGNSRNHDHYCVLCHNPNGTDFYGHQDRAAAGGNATAHAETNTTGSGAEACGVCHGEGAVEPVSVVHAR